MGAVARLLTAVLGEEAARARLGKAATDEANFGREVLRTDVRQLWGSLKGMALTLELPQKLAEAAGVEGPAVKAFAIELATRLADSYLGRPPGSTAERWSFGDEEFRLMITLGREHGVELPTPLRQAMRAQALEMLAHSPLEDPRAAHADGCWYMRDSVTMIRDFAIATGDRELQGRAEALADGFIRQALEAAATGQEAGAQSGGPREVLAEVDAFAAATGRPIPARAAAEAQVVSPDAFRTSNPRRPW